MQWLKAIILLPFNVLVIVPGILLYITGYGFARPSLMPLVLGIILMCFGILFAFWTMLLFDKFGQGTAAPWAPPSKFVVAGPYCYTRNPMISAVFMLLLAEYLFLNATVIFLWFLVFWFINLIYIRKWEEPTLLKRFGAAYKLYMQNVPRWLPRLKPWFLPKQ